MFYLFALFAFNILSLSLLFVGCGKKENENGNQTSTLEKTSKSAVELNFSQVDRSEIADRPCRRSDVYHEAAESLAYPASIRCKNHDDAWRMLALYLDYIRSVNPKEFQQYRLLDSALAVLHDFSHYIRSGEISSDTMALAVVYFLVDYHKIKINVGSERTPWFSALCGTAHLEDLEKMRKIIKSELIASRSDDTAVEI